VADTEVISKTASKISHWLGVTSTLVATATAIFTTQLAVSVNQRNARDRFFEKQLQACTDLGDASIPLQKGLTELDTGFFLTKVGHKPEGDATLDRGDKMVDDAYTEYRKITARLMVLYPDSFTPLEAQIVAFTPTTLRDRAEKAADPEAEYKTLRAGFTTADINLRQTCTSYLRRYAKANLMDDPK
jgi:hypothetical protein